eukprot:c21448_g1_i2 orf=336-1772(-)
MQRCAEAMAKPELHTAAAIARRAPLRQHRTTMAASNDVNTRLLDPEIGIPREDDLPGELSRDCNRLNFGSLMGRSTVNGKQQEDAAWVEARSRCGGLDSPDSRGGLCPALDAVQKFSGKLQLKNRSHYGKRVQLEIEKGGSKVKQEYYQRQKAALEACEEVDLLGTETPFMNYHKLEDGGSFAINASNLANIVLLIFKGYASVRSQSIAIIASTLDSLLDLLAGFILWFTQLSMKSFDIYKYPIGKARLKPVGIIVFAAVMATLGFQVLVQAVGQLIEHSGTGKMSISKLTWLCSIMGAAIMIKLALFLYCRSFKDEIIQAYSKDHYFDVITNISGLAAALLADQFFWWIDPVGAIFLAVYTITNWSQTVLENAVSLIGKAAPPEMLQKLTYLVLRHDDAIKRIDTVRAYTFGSYYFVEVDIELPEEMPLKEAHNIGETLQNKIECLTEVERAFVHLDFECEHTPEHSSHFKKFHPDE